MKVYVLLYQFWGDTLVLDVYSTEEAAYAYVAKQPKKERRNYVVEPFDVKEN